ncbi:MACPF domain-containing protein At4g24290-like isoform X1 [Hibiscus syriacus]|uniref:MACPF domain-containing protein At4g24290-like isoform X1 n=1 Tax=Hibiscus syriacus TaxID=106335 RepID=UPI001924C341|nr:MACPF domain-containing protein At4g24290-like isoform X1 [Hibiscus syriacus]
MVHKVSSQRAAEIAVGSIGCGYNLALDLKLKYCYEDGKDSPLIEFEDVGCYDVALPGGVSIRNVSKLIRCNQGKEGMRNKSDVISFQQMSEQFNHELSLSGKIPSGLFNAMFDFSGCWYKDAVGTKTLAFDGIFITLYTASLEKSQMVLRDHVRKAVPSSWEPAALARFIRTFGTHIIVGVEMGGKDVIYVKQQHSSIVQPADVYLKLKKLADEKFSKKNIQSRIESEQVKLNNQDISVIYRRRGGKEEMNLSHTEWLHTVQVQPEVVSMSFIPITSLLSGIPMSGFLNHAINLYLRYKPPLEELHLFLEFQLPRQWAPVFKEFPRGSQHKRQSNSFLQFKFWGPKLYVNTSPVDVGKRPVTGLRLYLEGKRSNRLAIYMQHLSSLPTFFQLVDEPVDTFPHQESYDKRYFEKVRWKNFSRVCTSPVEADNDHSIVTGAHLQVEKYGFKSILFVRLHFSTVLGAVIMRHSEWDGSFGFAPQSGVLSDLLSKSLTPPPPQPKPHTTSSTVYPGGPPMPNYTPKLLKFVDTSEMKRGPHDPPGYWVVSGARLVVEKGKIALRVKYSLLTAVLTDEIPYEH